MLRSGRCSSRGGGGLGGLLADRDGTGVSGSSMSSFNECLDPAGEFGVDMLACIANRGSRMIGGGNEL
jgi:hypothetical protein